MSSSSRLFKSILGAKTVALVVTAVSACDLLIDFGADQCNTNQDCADRAGSNKAFADLARCEDHVCVKYSAATGTGTGGGGGNTGCVSSKQCTEDNSGQPYICKTPGEPCVSLLSEDCLKVVGDHTDPNAIIIGMVTSWSGDIVKTYMNKATLGTANTMIADFENNVTGLPNPGGGGVRPLAIVACAEEQDTERAAKYLVETIGVKVLVGPLFGDVLKVAQNVTIPNKVLHIIPTAPVPQLSALNDEGRVWTIFPSHSLTMKVLGANLKKAEAELNAINPGEKLRLVLYSSVLDEDQQIAQYFLDQDVLVYNGKPAGQQQTDSDCGPEGCFKPISAESFVGMDNKVDFSGIIAAINNFNPHVIVLLDGPGTFGAAALGQTEDADTTPPSPFWLLNFPDAFVVPYMQGFTAFPPKPGFEDRIIAIDWPHLAPDLYQNFQLRFKAVCPECSAPFPFPPVIEYWYDALYMGAFSYLANGNYAIPTAQLTGTQLAQGFTSMCPAGQKNAATAIPHDMKPIEIQNLMNELTHGIEVDVRGASGELDYNLKLGSPVTTATVADMKVLCMSKGTDFPTTAGWGEATDYEVDTNAYTGPFVCPASPR